MKKLLIAFLTTTLSLSAFAQTTTTTPDSPGTFPESTTEEQKMEEETTLEGTGTADPVLESPTNEQQRMEESDEAITPATESQDVIEQQRMEDTELEKEEDSL